MTEATQIVPLVAGDEPLAENIRKSKNFNPSAVRQEYTDNVAKWQTYMDLMELDSDNIKTMVDRHGDEKTEPETKYTIRQKMAVVFNLIPSIVNMLVGYMYSEEPQIDAGGDKDLEDFIANCDGQGTEFKDFLRLRAFPLSLILGMVDTLVENPFGAGVLETKAEADEKQIRPVVYPITPLQRINWACSPNGDYHWICFKDFVGDDPNPLKRNPTTLEAYITVSAANDDVGGKDKAGFWIRSALGGPAIQTDQKPAIDIKPGQWLHTVGYTPMKRCAIATLYYRQSIDPRKKHTGVSKIAMMAILTRAILNVLSWTQEDIIANLAMIALPSKGGKRPTDDEGQPITPTLSPQTILWYDATDSGKPLAVQGEVSHIKIKLEFVSALVSEILRIANLMGASAEAGVIRSGVQGVVERNELFQELSQLAGGLDAYGYDVLALAKSWASGDDWTAQRLRDETKCVINHHKGPYTLDPLADVIQNSRNILGMFARISPTMAESALKYAARSFLYANDPDLGKILKEIKSHAGAEIALMVTQADEFLAGSPATVIRESTDLAAAEAPAIPVPAAG
jgi:hypothetical protein